MVQLSPDPDFHFEILRDLSAASYGGADIGEVLTAALPIIPGNFESYYSAFNTLGNNVLTTVQSTSSSKSTVSARDAYFHASIFFRSADFFLHGNHFRSTNRFAVGKTDCCF
jgi:hypothetical protein